jgi:hypothetical protein
MDKNFEKNIFLNCPFDEEYNLIFNAIVFTVHRCGFILRCAKEYDDSNSIRIKNIVELIKSSKYSIHDLSRVTSSSELPRFNMPLELGICLGALEFGSSKQKSGKYLILESQRYRFQKFISDISGQDIRSHDNDWKKVIGEIRNWLVSKTTESIPSPSLLLNEYEFFLKELPNLCAESQWLENELTFHEYTSLVIAWLRLNKH